MTMVLLLSVRWTLLSWSCRLINLAGGVQYHPANGRLVRITAPSKLSHLTFALSLRMMYGSPHGIVDTTTSGEHVGCKALRARLDAGALVPRLHVYGHIHDDRGALLRGAVASANVGCAPTGRRARRRSWERGAFGAFVFPFDQFHVIIFMSEENDLDLVPCFVFNTSQHTGRYLSEQTNYFVVFVVCSGYPAFRGYNCDALRVPTDTG
jgi:hypothetical protein